MKAAKFDLTSEAGKKVFAVQSRAAARRLEALGQKAFGACGTEDRLMVLGLVALGSGWSVQQVADGLTDWWARHGTH